MDGDAIRIDKASTKLANAKSTTALPPLSTQVHSRQNSAHPTTQRNATYLSRTVLRRAFRLRQLALCALAPVAVVIAAVAASTPAASHHVKRVVRMRLARDRRVDVLRIRRVGCAVAVAMREVLLLAHRLQWLEVWQMGLLLRQLLLLLLLLVWRSINDGRELGS